MTNTNNTNGAETMTLTKEDMKVNAMVIRNIENPEWGNHRICEYHPPYKGSKSCSWTIWSRAGFVTLNEGNLKHWEKGNH